MLNNQVQRVWEERIIFPENGSSIIHYFLRDSTKSSLLVVVGIERSRKHMTYTISDDFLRAIGFNKTINEKTRWKARKDVVEFLVSIIRTNGPIYRNPNQRIIEKQPSVEYLLSLMPRFSDCGGPSSGQGSRALLPDKSDIVWTGNSWRCNKKHTHYHGFRRNGIDIADHTFVIIKNEPIDEYIGYVLALYEDEQGRKMAYVLCFLHRQEMEYRYPDMELCSREVVITSHKQEVRAECIDGLTTVLTPNLFEKGLKVLPERLASQTFVCYRQYHEKEVKPFCMTELRSFSTQPMLLLICHLLSTNNQSKSSESGEEKKASKQKIKINKSRVPKPSCNILSSVVSKNTEIPCKVAGKDIKQFSQDKPPSQVLPNVVGENIELLCQDSGMRGCWFKCKILETKSKAIKVQYYDIVDVDGPEKLEEWVPSHRVANPDKLGLRNAGRLTVRPWPNREFSESKFEVGDAVDAWQYDGWWEGVVIGYPTTSSLNVYFPDEDKFSTIERKNLRASKDWIENKWIKVKSKPDIFSLLASSANPRPQVPPQPCSLKGDDAHMIISFNEASGSGTKRNQKN